MSADDELKATEPPPWFADALAEAQSRDRANVLMRDQEIGVMLMSYSLFGGLRREAGLAAMDRCLCWLQNRLNSERKGHKP